MEWSGGKRDRWAGAHVEVRPSAVASWVGAGARDATTDGRLAAEDAVQIDLSFCNLVSMPMRCSRCRWLRAHCW